MTAAQSSPTMRALPRRCASCGNTVGAPSTVPSDRAGRNSRLDEIQAAVLNAKLPHLDRWNAKRREISERYRQAIGGAAVLPPMAAAHVSHLCVVRTKLRPALQAHLARDGIATDIHYPVPDHRQVALRHVFAHDLSLPQSEAAAEEVLTLPCFPELTEDEVAASATVWRGSATQCAASDEQESPDRLERLDYAGFAKLASDDRLSKYEKIGFPNSYRAGYEEAIFADIRAKLPELGDRGLAVMDIGPGCSDLPRMLIEHCRAHGHRLHLVNSPEMLAQLARCAFIDETPGPVSDVPRRISPSLIGRIDVIICYSVLHYIFVDANPFDFIDLGVELLAPGGELLIGDVPERVEADALLRQRRREWPSTARSPARTRCPRSRSTSRARQDRRRRRAGLLARARAAGVDAYVAAAAADAADAQPARGHPDEEAVTMARQAMGKDRKLVIVGDSAFAEIAYEYFTHDSPLRGRRLRGRSAHYLKRDSLFGLPVVPFEELASRYPPDDARRLCRDRLHAAQPPADAARRRRQGRGLRAGQLRQPARLRLAQRRARRALLHLRGQRRCSRSSRSATMSCCGAATTSAITPASATTSSSPRTSWSRASARSARTASSASTPRSPTTSMSARDCWIGPGVVLGKDTKDGELYRSRRAEIAKVSAPRFFKVGD